mmetsp:Transcript_17820/g.54482  ORF Transcript_17820/g.54482 Transcript_17820/m.54482 type:complete len:108 (+) Transcript_17820:612-935(+)
MRDIALRDPSESKDWKVYEAANEAAKEAANVATIFRDQYEEILHEFHTFYLNERARYKADMERDRVPRHIRGRPESRRTIHHDQILSAIRGLKSGKAAGIQPSLLNF